MERQGEDQSTDLVEIERTEIIEEVETNEPETPEQSVREALKELQEGADHGGEGEEAPQVEEPIQEQPQPEKVTKGRKAKEAQAGEPAEDTSPPQRLNAADKETFNKLPARLKMATARMFKEIEALNTRTQQEGQRWISESRHIVEAVRPYYVSHPELAESGVTEGQLVAALIGAHAKLTNPKTDKAALQKLAADRGYKIQFLNEEGQAQTQESGAPNILENPYVQAMQARLDQLESRVGQFDEAQVSQASHSIIAEMSAVRDEKDQFGRYRYPEMHEPDFFERAKPLVSALVGTIPNLSYAEALKRAYASMTGKPIGNSDQANQARFPSTNTQNRAVSAAVTVRGRSAPPMSYPASDTQVSANETPEQSARIALEELRRGLS